MPIKSVHLGIFSCAEVRSKIGKINEQRFTSNSKIVLMYFSYTSCLQHGCHWCYGKNVLFYLACGP